MQCNSSIRILFDKHAEIKLRILNQTRNMGKLYSFILRHELARYISDHESAGIVLDHQCQEICYEKGLFLILHRENGVWYISDIVYICKDFSYRPICIWIQIYCNGNIQLCREIIGWRLAYSPVSVDHSA